MDESSGYVDVKVWRTGTDLSKTATVTVRSRKNEPVSAEGKVTVNSIVLVWSYALEDHLTQPQRPPNPRPPPQLDQTTLALAATWTLPLE